MKWKDWLEEWGMTRLKIKTPILELEFMPKDADRAAAWDLYVELLTRITTQELPDGSGEEKTALDSVHSLFETTRSILKARGRQAEVFTKIAIVVLNQIVRPFTAKWHRLSLEDAFARPETCTEFRQELRDLQSVLSKYTRALADIADVEDLTDLEDVE